MTTYYNENDRKKAASLRELIKWNLIAQGEVDERSIEDVRPGDLARFTQCHFFAGVGIWSYALRLAGWPDSREVWTGSCPCPSFSTAGKGEGFEDARHLWPAWYRLIRECRPATVFGEQVAAAIGFGWLDLVQTDMEAEAYSLGKIVLGACSVGAPHIRQRLYFVADSANPDRWCGERREKEGTRSHGERQRRSPGSSAALIGSDTGCTPGLAEQRHESGERLGRGSSPLDSARAGARGEALSGSNAQLDGTPSSKQARKPDTEWASESSDSIHPDSAGSFSGQQGGETLGYGSALESTSGISDCLNSFQSRLEGQFGDVRDWRGPGWLDPVTARSVAEAGATRGFWGNCDWWYGRDGKYRPIGAGLFPLAYGAPERVGRLSCYGDGIVAQVAQAFIEAYMNREL